jgi:AFG3 family protein
LTSALGSRAAAPTGAEKVGDWRFLLASSQFRRLFADGSNKSELSFWVWVVIWSAYVLYIYTIYNAFLSALDYEKYHPKEKEQKPEGDGSDESEPKSK